MDDAKVNEALEARAKDGWQCDQVAIGLDSAAEVVRALLGPLEAELAWWRENVEVLLTGGPGNDPDVIRSSDGGVAENMLLSLVLTMARTRRARDDSRQALRALIEAFENRHLTWARSGVDGAAELDRAIERAKAVGRGGLWWPEPQEPPYQARVQAWIQECFGPKIAADPVERNFRFLEEALELVQALGCSRDDAGRLVEYVYGRPPGEPVQEVGGVAVCLALLCTTHAIDMNDAAETELRRVWTKIPQIRAKQAAKPLKGPLPGPSQET